MKGRDVVQFRMFAPKLGGFKGLLCAKRGIECIQLPDSLMKIRCSRSKSATGEVTFILKRTFPSELNQYVDRALDPDKNDPPLSFYDKKSFKKGLCDMYQRMLLGYGVPKKHLVDYVKTAKKEEVGHLKHASLVGVADPTDEIPYGWVFIPGCKCICIRDYLAFIVSLSTPNLKFLDSKNSYGDRDIFGQCLKYGKIIVSRR